MKLLCLCTGNTCRSPMLATLLRSALDRRGLRGITVESAGTGATNGEPASAEAVACLASQGLDLGRHRSRHVSTVDLGSYDRILCMTSSHAAFVRSSGVPPERIFVVNAERGGVPDPYGGSAADYELCCHVLERAAATLAAELAAPAAGPVTTDPLARAREAIDAAHAAEPVPPAGKPSELAYADHVERWIARLVANPGAALQLAARCQHLERWVIPRASFPMDKPGYFTWRKAVHRRQGERARILLLGAGVDTAIAARVEQLVAKAAPKGDAEAQALEDAACLAFLDTELALFASQHGDYTRDKFIDIIRKTWRKMSPAAHALALGLPLPPGLKELVQAAVADG
jgi:protein-tyrosine-phosphatase